MTTVPNPLCGGSMLAVAISAALCATPQSYAQQASDSLSLEEIVVTATKRTVNLQDVAQSITVLSTLQQGIGDGKLRWVTVRDGGLGTKVGTAFPSASVWLLLGGLIFLRTDELVDPLRKEPCFQAIERALGFLG